MSEIAVNVFFITSGFLVSISAINSKSIYHYIVARVLRIYPALLVVVLLCAFVLGPLLTSLALETYFSTKSVYGYVGYNAVLLFPHKMRFELPGVFDGLPYPYVVNGSLWTLPWELWMYICVAVLAVSGLMRRAAIIPLWAALFVLHILMSAGAVQLDTFHSIAARFGVYFSTGAVFAVLGDRIRLHPAIAIVLLSLYCITLPALGGKLLLPVVLSYLTFFLALHPPLVIKRWSAGADLSYGIYLYAYPMQQVLVVSGFASGALLNSLATFAITLPCAAASWYLIEEPALRLKSRVELLIARWRVPTLDAA